MSGLTVDQLTVVRSWVGSYSKDSVLHDRYNRLQDLDDVILEELRFQLAEWNSMPASFGADGVSISVGENVRNLQKTIQDFVNVGGTGDDDAPKGSFGVSKLVRPDIR